MPAGQSPVRWFALTNFAATPYNAAMDELVFAVQQFYPRVYHACHAEHVRKRSTPFRLSARDSAILAHLGQGGFSNARDLAHHLGIGAPTMSSALQHLERQGYLARGARTGRSPERRLALTEAGRAALQATSVLATDRVAALLQQLPARDRARAVAGLGLLAKAAHRLTAMENAS